MEKHIRYLVELAFLDSGSRWQAWGRETSIAEGILTQDGHSVTQGECDGILAIRAFSSGEHTLAEAAASLRKGGKLVFSDVTDNVVTLLTQLRRAGFAMRHMEDLTADFPVPSPTDTYILFVCERM